MEFFFFFFFSTTVSRSGIDPHTQRNADVSRTHVTHPRGPTRARAFSSMREILWRDLSRVQIADLASSPLSMTRRAGLEWLLRLFRLLRSFARKTVAEIKNRYKFRRSRPLRWCGDYQSYPIVSREWRSYVRAPKSRNLNSYQLAFELLWENENNAIFNTQRIDTSLRRDFLTLNLYLKFDNIF